LAAALANKLARIAWTVLAQQRSLKRASRKQQPEVKTLKLN
jgi:hypothetical protein